MHIHHRHTGIQAYKHAFARTLTHTYMAYINSIHVYCMQTILKTKMPIAPLPSGWEGEILLTKVS